MKYLFMTLSIGLTFISLHAGFHIYEIFFGVFTAFLISGVFELLRLTCLYSISKFSKGYKTIATLLYIVVAGVCFIASVASFNAKVMEKLEVREKRIHSTINNDIYKVKKAYSDKKQKEIDEVRTERAKYEEQYARFKYKAHLRIIEGLIDKEQKLIQEREKYFSSLTPDKEREWISNQKAILGLEDIDNNYDNNISASEKAILDTFKIDHLSFKKFIGFALAFVVEFGIIMLALLAIGITAIPKKKGRPKKTWLAKMKVEINKTLTERKLYKKNAKLNKKYGIK